MSHIAPDGPVYQAGTLSANPVAMAAGYAAMKELLAPNTYNDLEEKTKAFAKQITDYCEQKNYELSIATIGSIFWIAFAKSRITRADEIDAKSMDKFKILHHELLQRGVYLGPSGYEVGFVSTAHSSEDLAKAAGIICECLDVVFN